MPDDTGRSSHIVRFLRAGGVFGHQPMIDPPFKPAQMAEGEITTGQFGHPRNLHGFELIAVLDFNPAVDRAVGEIDHHHELVGVVMRA